MNFSNWSKDWHLAEEFVYTSDYSRSSTCSSENSPSDWNCDWFSTYKTKEGSMLLQRHLLNSGPEELEKFVTEIKSVLPDLVKDSFANYAVQKLIQIISASQRLSLISLLSDSLFELSKHPRATHVIQLFASLCSSPEEETLYTNAFRGRVIEMAFHPYASHVLEKLLVNISQRHLIVREISGHASKLAMDKHGVCVINAILKDPLILSELMGDLLQLIQDPYGNYSVQILIATWKEEIAFDLCSAIKGRVCQLSMQKFSSNVIETCIQNSDIRQLVLKELTPNVDSVLASQFGGYVVKTALKFASQEQREMLVTKSVQSAIRKWETT